MKKIVFVFFHVSPAAIAFIDGIFISVGINVLTGLSSCSGLQIFFAVLSAVFFIALAIVLFIWQNLSSSANENYKQWQKCIQENRSLKKVTGVNDKDDWSTYLACCFDYNNYKNDPTKIGGELIVELRYRILVSLFILTCIFFALSIAFLICSYLPIFSTIS